MYIFEISFLKIPQDQSVRFCKKHSLTFSYSPAAALQQRSPFDDGSKPLSPVSAAVFLLIVCYYTIFPKKRNTRIADCTPLIIYCSVTLKTS